MQSTGGTTATGPRRLTDSRGQTATIGVVLVFGMVLAASVIIVTFGSGALAETQDGLSVDRAQKTMTQLDSKAALVALENAATQQLNFAADETGSFEMREDGSIRIKTTNLNDFTQTQLLEQDLGSLVYTSGDTTLAYQGGGVWRQEGDAGNSLMVSPPEFHYRDGTLTLPIIAVDGERSISNGATVSFNDSEQVFPDSTIGNRNPLRNTVTTVTVQSEYYQGWGRYFEQRTDGEVTYDHAAEEVSLELVAPIGQQRITSATASLSASGEFIIQGKAKSACSADDDHPANLGDEMYTNSYDSSASGDYCDQAVADALGDNGDVVYGEDVDISFGTGGSWIHGDVVSGGSVEVSGSGGSGQVSVYGHINYSTTCDPSVSDCEDRVKDPSAGVQKIGDIPKATQINGYVQKSADDIAADNDNAGAPISGQRIDYGGTGDATLTEGRYFLTDLNMPAGNRLILDTGSGGRIDVAIDENVVLNDDARIEIVGDGTVRFFLANNTAAGTTAFAMDKNTAITAPDDNATQFRLYGKDSMTARIGDGSNSHGPAKFVGVLYAPPGVSGSGEVVFKKGELFGGVLTSTTIIDNAGGSLHYDEALASKQIIEPGANVVKVTYLHVSVNRITLTGR